MGKERHMGRGKEGKGRGVNVGRKLVSHPLPLSPALE